MRGSDADPQQTAAAAAAPHRITGAIHSFYSLSK